MYDLLRKEEEGEDTSGSAVRDDKFNEDMGENGEQT